MFIFRSQNGYEYMFSDEEEDLHKQEEEEEEEEAEEERSFDRYEYHQRIENDHLVADVICGGEALLFLSNDADFDHRVLNNNDQNLSAEEFKSSHESLAEEEEEDQNHHQDENYATELLSMHDTDTESDHDHEYDHHGNDREKIPPRDTNRSIRNSISNNEPWPTSPVVTIDLRNDKICHGTSTSHTSKFVTLASHMLYFNFCYNFWIYN